MTVAEQVTIEPEVAMTARKPQSDEQTVLALVKETEVMKRRLLHEPFRDIAADMGISVGGAYEAFKRAKGRLIDSAVLVADEWRTVMLESYERDLVDLQAAVDDGSMPLSDAIMRRSQIRAGMRELLGLDAPTKFTSDQRVEVHISGGEGV